MAFFIWFAITPLLPEIEKSLSISQHEIWNSSIAGICGTIVIRLILGPLCDVYGPRVLMATTLCLAAIPAACTGFVQTATGLVILRLFIGIAGGTFVMCQYWTTSLFSLEVVGLANGIAGGWGNLGAGVTHTVMGLGLFPLFTRMFDGDADKAWRTVSVVPAVVAVGTGILIYFVSDDTPKGNYSELKKRGVLSPLSVKESLYMGATNMNTWLIAAQYGCCFGVQLTMNTAAALYFEETFGQSKESSIAIASVFSWMLLFARALGGFSSDIANTHYGMRGRIMIHTIFLVCEGAIVLIFSHTKSLIGAIFIMMIFSIFVSAATGSSFGIVPYIDPSCTGSVIGIVGAGGNVGAAIFGWGFHQLSHRSAFHIMGIAAIASGVLSFFINIEGQTTLLQRDKSVRGDGKSNDKQETNNA